MKYLLAILLMIPSLSNAAHWECIARGAISCHTWRMEVPPGWIVSGDIGTTGSDAEYAMVFVPDAEHKWKV